MPKLKEVKVMYQHRNYLGRIANGEYIAGYADVTGTGIWYIVNGNNEIGIKYFEKMYEIVE